jgi:predicted ATPase
MIFSFKNLGIVESADIELKGLTVITGLNDTGKSFIGKSIYSIVKTLSEADDYISRLKFQNANNFLNQINITHRQLVPFTQEKLQKFNTNLISQKLLSSLINKQIPVTNILIDIKEYSDKVIEDLENTNKTRPDLIKQFENAIQIIKTHTHTLISIIEDKPSDETKYKRFFDEQVIQRIFQSQLNGLSKEN